MRVTLRGNRYSSLWWEDVRSRVFLQKLLSESNQSPYLSLQFWLLWCIESHQRQERRKHQRPLEDDRGTTKRKCEEVLETERVRRTRAQSTSFSLDLLKRQSAPSSLHKGVKRASSLTCWLTHPSKRHQRRHLKNMTDETMEDDSVVSLESSGGSELSVKLLSVCRSY